MNIILIIQRLNIVQVKQKLLKLDYIKKELGYTGIIKEAAVAKEDV